jgi:TolB-like protein/Tfp pilus assembly protein PilF
MKRCPACKRVENDDTLVFCRTDGTPLVSDSGAVSGDAGTMKFGSAPGASETETSILQRTATDAGMSRPTGPTTVLDPQQTIGRTHELSRPKRTKVIVFVGVALLIAAIAVSAYFYLSRKNSAAINSIAVLPFQNKSGDPNAEYLSDGIAESLINSLTQLQQLRVVARTTAFRYKGKDVDPQRVGRDLNVRAVLSGRVQQMGDTLNIQVDLVDVTTGAQLWGEEYNRKAADVLAVKQDIAREVTDKLRLRLSGEEQRQLAKRDTTNPEAYQFYLKGRYYWNKRTGENLRKAIEQFQRAVDLDPNYALGYVGLADSYLLLEDYAGAPAHEILPKARAAVERALQIDDSLAEAHTSIASLYARQWRWTEAEEEFKRAITLNPNYPTAHHWFSAYYLRPRGQLDDALREAKRAQELDPLSLVISTHVASIYIQKNDIGSGIEESQKTVELDPRFANAHDNLGWAFLKQHRYEEAIAEFQKALELSGRQSNYLCDLGYIYGLTGKRGEALQILKELEERYARREAGGIDVAAVCAGLGDKDQVFHWLEKDFERHSGLLPDFASWFNFDDLHSDPRYADLLRRMGLKP